MKAAMIQLTDHNDRPIMFYPNRLRLVQRDETDTKTLVTVAGFGECEELPEQIKVMANLIGLTDLEGRVIYVRPSITGIRGYRTGSLIYVPGVGIKEVRETPQNVSDIQATAQVD